MSIQKELRNVSLIWDFGKKPIPPGTYDGRLGKRAAHYIDTLEAKDKAQRERITDQRRQIEALEAAIREAQAAVGAHWPFDKLLSNARNVEAILEAALPSEPELEPCPFCGGQPQFEDHSTLYPYTVVCECGIHGPGNDDKAEAREAWNKRA